MSFQSMLALFLLVLASACAPSLPEVKGPPAELNLQSEPPFLREKKVEVPAEARALGHFLKGQILLGQGEFGQAVMEYEQAVKADPSNAFLRGRLAKLYVRKGDLKRAQMEAEEAARLDPKDVQNHLLLGGIYASLGQNFDAIREYGKVLELEPENQEALLYLGAIHLKTGNYEKAEESLNQLLSVNPS
jgi:tetratricopeptide (TPR) repeat protein